MRIKSLAQGENILMLRFEPATFVSKIDILTTTPIVHFHESAFFHPKNYAASLMFQKNHLYNVPLRFLVTTCPECRKKLAKPQIPLVCLMCAHVFYLKCTPETRLALEHSVAAEWRCSTCRQHTSPIPTSHQAATKPVAEPPSNTTRLPCIQVPGAQGFSRAVSSRCRSDPGI